MSRNLKLCNKLYIKSLKNHNAEMDFDLHGKKL